MREGRQDVSSCFAFQAVGSRECACGVLVLYVNAQMNVHCSWSDLNLLKSCHDSSKYSGQERGHIVNLPLLV